MFFKKKELPKKFIKKELKVKKKTQTVTVELTDGIDKILVLESEPWLSDKLSLIASLDLSRTIELKDNGYVLTKQNGNKVLYPPHRVKQITVFNPVETDEYHVETIEVEE